jgi:hypothetical protein
VLALLALILPVANFLRILPAIEAIYNHPISPGWGVWILAVGLVGSGAIWIVDVVRNGRLEIGD